MAELLGLKLDSDIPDNWTILEVVGVAKCLDEDGGVALVHIASEGLNAWEAAGMLLYGLDANRDLMQENSDG